MPIRLDGSTGITVGTAVTVGTSDVKIGSNVNIDTTRIVGVSTIGVTTAFITNINATGVSRLGNGVVQGAPSSTDITTNAYAVLSGAGANYLSFGQYGSDLLHTQWIQSGFLNPSTATYDIVLQPIGGDVGVGTASPAAKLQSAGTSGSPQFRAGTATNGYFEINAFDSNPVYCVIGGSNATAGVFGTQSNIPTIFFSNNSERARITNDGSFSITQTPGKYTVDTTGGATSIANNGTVDFSNASGMLVVNNHSNGAVTIYLCGGGSTLAASSVIAQVGTLTYVVGINGYRFTNTYGSAATFGFFFVRTRNNA